MIFSMYLGMLLMTAAALGAPAGAPADPPLTWEACVAEASERHPTMRKARLRLEVARLRQSSAFAGFLPRVNASAGRDRSGGPPWFRGAPNEFGTSLSASQSLFAGFGTLAEMARAASGLRQQEAEFRSAEAEVRRRLRQAFIGTLYAQEQVGLRETFMARRRENVTLVRGRVEAGKEDASTREQEEAEQARAEFEVSKARRALARAQQRLSREIGRTSFRALTVEGRWEAAVPPTDPDLAALADASPGVVASRAAVDEARAGIREAAAAFWPSLDLSGSASRSGPGWPPAETSHWSLGLSLSIPVFAGGHDRVAVAIARSEEAQAVEQLVLDHRDEVESLEEALEPYANAYEGVVVRAKSAAAARGRADVARAAYAKAEQNYDQWHELEGALVESELEALDARKELLDTETNWLHATGTGLK